jgi:hypothetical protein
MLASPNLLVVDIADKPDEPMTVSSSSVNTSSSAATVEPKKSGSGGGSVPLLILGLLGLLAVNTRYSFAVNAHGN